MSITRSPRINRDFTIVSNTVCLDQKLTMRALGVLVRLLCRPDNWRTSSERLAAEFGCGRDAVRGALRELQDAGYLRLVKQQDSQGHWGTNWMVFEEPQKADGGETEGGNSDAGRGGPVIRTDVTRTDVTRTEIQIPRARAQPVPRGGASAKAESPAGSQIVKAKKTTQSATAAKPGTVGATELEAAGIPAESATAWLAQRKEKRLPLTTKAWNLTVEDGRSVGLSPAETVEACIRRGWAAFRVDWWTPPQATTSRPASAAAEKAASRRAFTNQIFGATGHDETAIDVDARDITDTSSTTADRD